jgi:hypothetical protein
MDHLTESQLSEYFDHALDDTDLQAAEAHLSACAECRRALDELQRLAATLESLPEEHLPRDLSAFVLAALPEQKISPGWKLILVAQAGIAIGMILLLISNLEAWFQPQKWLTPIFSWLTHFKPPLIQLPSWVFPISLPPVRLPVLALQMNSINITVLIVASLLLFGLGNFILLRGRQEIRK